jgi:isopenicillin-N epimerase
VARIAALARSAGVPILVDGAHAPGHIPLDVPALHADWYTGNAHKWLFAPRGCGLLWTAPRRQNLTRPAVLSHGIDQGYTAAFDWIGTRDPTPWLCFETAALAHDDFGGRKLMADNKSLAAVAAQRLAAALDAHVTAPDAMRGAMAAFLLENCRATDESAAAIRRTLWERDRIIAPVYCFAGRLCFRVSAQLYNGTRDYEALARVGKNRSRG